MSTHKIANTPFPTDHSNPRGSWCSRRGLCTRRRDPPSNTVSFGCLQLYLKNSILWHSLYFGFRPRLSLETIRTPKDLRMFFYESKGSTLQYRHGWLDSIQANMSLLLNVIKISNNMGWGKALSTFGNLAHIHNNRSGRVYIKQWMRDSEAAL